MRRVADAEHFRRAGDDYVGCSACDRVVVTLRPATADIGSAQARTGSPSSCTVQAPQGEGPHPGRGARVRSACSRGVSASEWTATLLPSMRKRYVGIV